MSEQSLTYESILELFRESERERKEFSREWRERSAEFDRQMQETDLQIKEAHKKISALGSRIGEMIECMVEGGIVDKFQALGYEITQCARKYKFGLPKSVNWGEIDLYLENGDIVILSKVKTTLETADVRKHIERMEKFRRCADEKGDKHRFVGAVAGAVVEGEAEEFVHANGMYVIIQSGEAVEIVPVPEGFQVKEW